MERLTEYRCGVAVIKNKELLKEAMAKLAAYEDAEEEGRLKEVLCKYGDIVYFIQTFFGYLSTPIAGKVYNIQISDKGQVIYRASITNNSERSFSNGSLGRRVFFTREEAEKALEALTTR